MNGVGYRPQSPCAISGAGWGRTRKSCSSASTTPAGVRWGPQSWITLPKVASTYAPPGATPVGEINPAVVTVVEEIGLDLSKEFPKPLKTDIVEAADVVITMGRADARPVFPGRRYLDWELPDPPASRSSSYRHRRLTAVGRTRERLPDTRRGHGIRLKMKSNSVPPLRDFSVIVPRAFR